MIDHTQAAIPDWLVQAAGWAWHIALLVGAVAAAYLVKVAVHTLALKVRRRLLGPRAADPPT